MTVAAKLVQRLRSGRKGFPSVAVAALVALVSPAARAADEIRAVDLGGIEARSAALLLSGQEAGDLEASFLAVPMAATPVGTPILVVADLAGTSLLETATGPELIVEVYAYLLDAEDRPRATMTRAFRLELPLHRAALESGGVKLLGDLSLPRGATAESLRLLVLHRASGRFALGTLPLPLSAVTPDTPGAGAPPLVLERREPWLIARLADSTLPAYLDLPGGVPATRLLASAGGSLRLRLAADGGAASFVATLLDAEGEPLADLSSAVITGDPSAGDVALDLGQWPPQSYQLEVAAGGEPERALRLPLELVADRLADGALWFQHPQTPTAGEATASRQVPGRPSQLPRLALAAYQRAFEAWDSGDLEQAAAELRRFETAASSSDLTADLPIEEGQLRAAAQLMRQDSEVLVPLMCLHERLFRFYQLRDSYLLASHSQRMASELARLYAARGGQEAKRVAALVPVSLAGARQEIGTRIAAQSTFESALELDPRQPEALLGLAALHESFGHYDTAVELLHRLDRAAALSAPAKIRLAVNLGRLGSTRQALELLAELADGPAGWVSRLAYQEWARLLAGKENGAEAVSVLATARDRYPDDQGLIIQQAALLDRLGRPLAGQRVLTTIDGSTGDRGASPRLRYSELPSREIEAARARLARAAGARLAGALETARALEAGGAP